MLRWHAPFARPEARQLEESGGQQGLASLPTFWAMPESRSPRAATERAGGKRVCSFHRPLTLTLSREGRGDWFALRVVYELDPRLRRG